MDGWGRKAGHCDFGQPPLLRAARALGRSSSSGSENAGDVNQKWGFADGDQIVDVLVSAAVPVQDPHGKPVVLYELLSKTLNSRCLRVFRR